MQKIGRKTVGCQTLIDAISGLMVDFLQFIDVNARGLRLQKGQGISHPIILRTWISIRVISGPENLLR